MASLPGKRPLHRGLFVATDELRRVGGARGRSGQGNERDPERPQPEAITATEHRRRLVGGSAGRAGGERQLDRLGDAAGVQLRE